MRKMNRKGSAFSDLFLLIAILMVAVFLFAGMVFGVRQVNTALSDIDLVILGSNVTIASDQTFAQIDTAMGGMKWVAVAIFFGMMVAIFVSNFLVKAHSVFFVVYILLTVIAVVFSTFVSNSYETMLSSGVLAETLQSFSPTNFIILNLPTVITLIGFIGALFLFIGVTVDRQQGGGLS